MNGPVLSVGPWTGPPQLDVTPLVKSWKVSAKRKDPTTISFDIDGSDPSLVFRELVDDIWFYWGTVRVRARIAPAQDTLDSGSHASSVTAVDYRAVLARRLIWDNWILTRVNADPAFAAWELVRQAQAEPGGDLRIVRGQVPATPISIAAITHQAGAYTGDEIVALSKLGDGFDWDVTPQEDGTFTFDVWRPGRGRVTDVVLEYGPAGIPGRQVDSTAFGNAVRAPGGTDPAGAQAAAVRREAADIATRPEGRWDLAVQDAGTAATSATAAALADNALAAAQVLQPSYTFTLGERVWGGPDDFWIGDTVTLQLRSGRLLIDEQLSVEALDITGDPGLEFPQVSVTLGAYTALQAERLKLRAIDRTLGMLSRR